MVFVTVGTQKQQFNRLMSYLKYCKKPLIVQNGFTNCEYKHYDFLEYEKMQEYMKKAEYIISHGGISIMEALNLNKKVLVIPREKKHKEHVNNHQFELCEYLEKEGYILVARNEEEFIRKLNEIKNFKPKKYENNSKEFYKNFDNILNDIINK